MEFSGETMGPVIFFFMACFLCTQHLSHVLTLDALVTFLSTTYVICFPIDVLTTVAPKVPVDALHGYLTVLIMTAVLPPALVWFLSTDPSDVTIRTAIAISRVVGFACAASMTFWEQSVNAPFDPWWYSCTVFPMAALAIAYMIHIFYNSRVNVQVRYGNLNTHLSGDLVLSVLCALVCIGFTSSIGQIFGQTLDNLHIFLYRMYGFLVLGQATLPWLAPRFRSMNNKRAVLFSRALSLLVGLSITFYKYHDGSIPEEGHGAKLLVLTLIVMTLPAASGSARQDYGNGWDLPWRGLRVPAVAVGGGGKDLLKDFKEKVKPKKTSGRGNKRGRSSSRKRR